MFPEPIPERHMLPRWRAFKDALRQGELRPQNKPLPPIELPEEVISKRIENWSHSKTLSFAVELVEADLFSKEDLNSRDAANFIIEKNVNSSRSAKLLANRILSNNGESEFFLSEGIVDRENRRKSISFLKNQLKSNPHNPFVWADLAFYYGVVGSLDHAKKALRVALAMAPESRFIARSLTRLLTHSGDIDQALFVLRGRERLRHDPWLMAAEIAVADLAGKKSLAIKDGIATLKSGKYSPFHLSELNSAIATLELSHGANRNSRKLFVSSMNSPTENSCAQFEWAVKNKSISRPEGLICHVPGNFEARSYSAYMDSDWEKALKFGWLWCVDQPFSLDASVWGSYLASTALNKYSDAIKIAKIGLDANPKNWLLENNLAVSLAKSGKALDAKKVLEEISAPKDDVDAKATLLATNGLINFRLGNVETGRDFYQKSIDIFKSHKKHKSTFIALAFWILEESRFKNSFSDILSKDIIEIQKKIGNQPEVGAILSKLNNETNYKFFTPTHHDNRLKLRE